MRTNFAPWLNNSLVALLFFMMMSFTSKSQTYLLENFENSGLQNWELVNTNVYTSQYGCPGSPAGARMSWWGYVCSLSTPLLSTTGNDIAVSFDYKLNAPAVVSGNWGSIQVEYSFDGGVNWLLGATVDPSNHTPTLDCTNFSFLVNGSAIPTGFVKFRFVMQNGGGFTHLTSLDNVSIIEQFSCQFPINLTELSAGPDSVTLTWVPNGSESEWALEYGPTGFTPGTGTTQIVTNDTATITGIPTNGLWEVYVRAICGPSDTSVYANQINFNTLSQPIYIGHDFDCSPLGYYDIQYTGQPYILGDDDEINTSMPMPFLFNGTMISDLLIGSNGGVLFDNPQGNVNTGGAINDFNTKIGMYPFWDDLDPIGTGKIYTELVGTAPNRSFIIQFQERGQYSAELGQTITFQIQMEEGTNEIYFLYEDTEFGGTQTQHDHGLTADIGIKGYSNNTIVSHQDSNFLTNNTCAHFFYIDCPEPMNYHVISSTENSAVITWGSSVFNETDWTVIYGVQGFDPLTSGTTINTTQDTLTISGLLDQTLFDVYIYADCDPGVSQGSALIGQFLTLPNCSNPTGINGTTAIDSIFMAWTWTESSGVGAFPVTGFNLQHGYDGFNLGTGTIQAADANFTDSITAGIQTASNYDIYVQAVCGSDVSDYIGPFSVFLSGTPANDSVCGAYPLETDGTIYAFNNQFATVQPFEPFIAPPVTGSQSTIGWEDGELSHTMWYTFVAPSSGNVRISCTQNGNNYNGQAAIYEVGNCADFQTFQLIAANDNAIEDDNSTAPDFKWCGLTPGNTYYLIHDSRFSYFGSYTIQLTEIFANAGTAGPIAEICNETSLVLPDYISGEDLDGNWTQILPSVNSNQIAVANIPTTPSTEIYQYNYVVTNGCLSDTSVVQFSVNPSNYAGADGTLTACTNGPLNLYSGLSGLTDLDGSWYPMGSTSPIPNGDITTGGNGGVEEYIYIVNDGICSADTSYITVTVDGTCNFLDVESLYFSAMKVFPNPTNGNLYISNLGSSEIFNATLLDLKGKVLFTEINAVDGEVARTFDLSKYEAGVYLLRLFNANAEKTIRIILN